MNLKKPLRSFPQPLTDQEYDIGNIGSFHAIGFMILTGK